MGTVIGQKKADTTKTTCIEITAENYKCIDISAYVPTCIMITSNVPTSEHYEKPRADLLITEAPQLQIALINNEAPILNVNLDANGVYYVTDFDTVYIDITNWNANAEYVNVFSNEDGNAAVIFLDEVEQRIVWALDDWAMDGVQMWLYAQAKESDKLISPQSSVTVMQMEQTDHPNLSSWVSQYENTVLNITILDYDATYTYADPIVTGGTAVRTDNIIAWTLPDVTADTYHEISITATAPLMYESLVGVSGGTVINDLRQWAYVEEQLITNVGTFTKSTSIQLFQNEEGKWISGIGGDIYINSLPSPYGSTATYNVSISFTTPMIPNPQVGDYMRVMLGNYYVYATDAYANSVSIDITPVGATTARGTFVRNYISP